MENKPLLSTNQFPTSLPAFNKPGRLIERSILLLALFFQAHFLLAQSPDTTRSIIHFSGAASVTNNGISLIPTFSLGKPAAIFNLALGRKKLSFEPEMRFALDGKPWSFVFWWRYKLLTTNKFQLKLGAHPALNFRAIPALANGDTREMIVSRRFLATEVAPTYKLSKNIGVGMYYLYARGFDIETSRNTQFLTINSTFSNIRLPGRLLLQVTPQVFYLKMDSQDGFYVNSAFTLARKNFPLSLGSIINKTIDSEIAASKKIVWNATLIYSFHKSFVAQ